MPPAFTSRGKEIPCASGGKLPLHSHPARLFLIDERQSIFSIAPRIVSNCLHIQEELSDHRYARVATAGSLYNAGLQQDKIRQDCGIHACPCSRDAGWHVLEWGGACLLDHMYQDLQQPIGINMSSTTVWVTPENKSRLAALKRHPKESYNDVIARLIDMAVDDEPLSEEAIRGIEEALEDIRAGRLYTEDEIEREFGAKE